MTFSALDSALLGPLVTRAAMRAAFSETSLLSAMLAAEAALARAQARFGIVPPDLAPAIERLSAAEFELDHLGAATALAGVPTIPFVKRLQALLPPDLEPHVHRGATTQDILDTAFVLQMQAGFDALAADLGPLLDGLSSLAERYRRAPCTGRTYGQHAAPITFGFKAAVWLAGANHAVSGLKSLRQRTLVASLGGPVGTFAAMGERGPAVLEAFAAELGLGATTIAWHTTRGRMAEIANWLAMLIGALAKMATDIADLASTEIGEVAEPYQPGRGGSSAMPHKRNPVSCTVILAAHRVAPALAASVTMGMAAAHERPAGAWHGEWHALPQLFGLAAGALDEARLLATGLEVDTARMAANLEATGGLIFADKVASRLASRIGRGRAHALVEEAAATARARGIPLAQALADEPALTGIDLAGMFDLTPAIAAAQPWIDRVLAETATLRRQLP